MSMQQMLLATNPLLTLSFINYRENDTGAATSASIDAPSGISSGDISILYAWCDVNTNPTLNASSSAGTWVKISQSSSTDRPAIGIWYSTSVTQPVTVTSTSSGSWNLIWQTFRPSRLINSTQVGASSILQRQVAYTHSITAPSDGASYTYLHSFGVSGRPQDNLSDPASITGTPSPIKLDDSSVDSAAVSFYSVFSPNTASLPNYSYNNINDSGRMASAAIWLGFN